MVVFRGVCHVEGDGCVRVGGAGFRVEMEVAGVFNVEWWLEILGENVRSVVF